MSNINLTSRLSAIVIGLLIYFVPFFTYLSPANLKELSRSSVLEIFLSLIVFLIIIFISSISVENLLKRLFKKKIILFPLLCFAFYLNFLYLPFTESLREFFYPNFGYLSETSLLICFELFCFAIIIFGAKFNVFSIRMILIFSIMMLINAFIPLANYLSENNGKNPTISYELKSNPLIQDKVQLKRNVYYIILDGMMAIETAEESNITTKKEVIDYLSNTGLKYVDKSQSSYDHTPMSMASIMLLDYNQRPSSPKFRNLTNFFPGIMEKNLTELPLLSYLKVAGSSFLWSGNSRNTCISSSNWKCIDSLNIFFSSNLIKFFFTTPLPKSLTTLFKDIRSQNSIGPFLEYIDINGVPKSPIFAFIHHDSPHDPYLLTSECEPTMEWVLSKQYLTRHFEGYKASYHCVLKTIQIVMKKINDLDPEAIVIFQSDHGWDPHTSNKKTIKTKLTKEELYQYKGKIFSAIKAPEICFKKYGLPKTNINTIRFAMNCAYGFKLPYLTDRHYSLRVPENGTVIERILYE